MQNLNYSLRSFIGCLFKIIINKKLLKTMNHMGHVIKFLIIFRNNSRPHEKRYRFKILGNQTKGIKVRLYYYVAKKFFDNTNAL